MLVLIEETLHAEYPISRRPVQMKISIKWKQFTWISWGVMPLVRTLIPAEIEAMVVEVSTVCYCQLCAVVQKPKRAKDYWELWREQRGKSIVKSFWTACPSTVDGMKDYAWRPSFCLHSPPCRIHCAPSWSWAYAKMSMIRDPFRDRLENGRIHPNRNCHRFARWRLTGRRNIDRCSSGWCRGGRKSAEKASISEW